MPSLPVWSKGVCDKDSPESERKESDNGRNCDDDANSADYTASSEETEGSDDGCCHHDDSCDSGGAVSAKHA